MTIPAWPSTLPLPRSDTYEQKYGKHLVEFKADKVGVTKRRKVTTSAPRVLSFDLSCTDTQRVILVSFWANDLSNGVLPFSFPNPLNPSGTFSAYMISEPVVRVRPNTRRFLMHVELEVRVLS